MPLRPFFFLCFLMLCGCALGAAAGDAPQAPAVPEKPHFPFPEFPAILYFEDFEGGESVLSVGKVEDAPAVPTAGTPVAPVAPPPGPPAAGGGKAYLLGSVSLTNMPDKTGSAAKLSLAQAKVRVPGGNRTNQIILHFAAYAEDPGDLQLTFDSKFNVRNPISATKKWIPLTVPFSEMIKLQPADVISEIQFLFVPRTGKAYVKVYIDDILITNGVSKPAETLVLARAARKRIKDIERTAAKDGFTFVPQNQELLRAAIAGRAHINKAKSVLVVGPCPPNTATLAKALTAAAAKAKLDGYTFTAAEAPDKSAVGGLDDMRRLLKHLLQKTLPQFVLLAPGYADAKCAGVPAESMRVVIERALAAGCIPLVSLPPLVKDLPQGDKTKIEGFVNAVSNAWLPKGITLVEASSVLNNGPAPLQDGELNQAGLEGVANVGVAAIKHLEMHLLLIRK